MWTKGGKMEAVSSSHHSGRRCSRLGVRWYLMWRGPVSFPDILSWVHCCTAPILHCSKSRSHQMALKSEAERVKENIWLGERTKRERDRRRGWREEEEMRDREEKSLTESEKREKVRRCEGNARWDGTLEKRQRAWNGCTKRKRWKEKEEESQFLKKTLYAEAHSSWIVVTVWKIREWKGDGHGGAVKYPEMNIPTLGDSEEEKSYGSAQMCSLHGNSRGLEL